MAAVIWKLSNMCCWVPTSTQVGPSPSALRTHRRTPAINISLPESGRSSTHTSDVFLSPEAASAALSSGDIDVWVVHDSFYALAERVQRAHAIASTKDIVNGNSVYVATPQFAGKYPKALAAVLDEVTNVTTRAGQNRDKFAEAISAAIGMDLDAVRVAIDRSNLTVGPVTRADIARLQETCRSLPAARFHF